MIKTVDLCKVYKTKETETVALKNVNLNIEKGEIVSILGPSGCGKSTLLNCLSGIDRPTSGNVYISGVEITKLKDDKLTDFRGRKMGFVFQFYNLIPVLSAVENVEMPLLIIGESEKIARKKSIELLDLVGLSTKIKKMPSSLSGGELQRVAIARALVTDPEIVWADEPTGALDTVTGKDIMKLIVSLNKKNNQTFVIVTHDTRVSNYSQTIYKMDSGKIVEIIK
jgi:putative ABC transport system ATP-binding protein